MVLKRSVPLLYRRREAGFIFIISLFLLWFTTMHGMYFLSAYEAKLQTYKSLEFMKLRVTMEIINNYRNK